MPRYAKHKIDKNGWTEWIRPQRKGYRMSCCDCGLVHEFDFATIKWGRGHKVIMRARRHERATAAKRRNRK